MVKMGKMRTTSWLGGSYELSQLVGGVLNSNVGKEGSENEPEEIQEDPIVVAVLDLCDRYLIMKLKKEGVLRGTDIKGLVRFRVNSQLGIRGYSGPDSDGLYHLVRRQRTGSF